MPRALSNPPAIRLQVAPLRASGSERRLAESAAQAILGGVAVLTPWLFGGVLTRHQQWIFFAVLAGFALALVRALRGPIPIIPWAVAPLAVAVAWGALHLVPLGPSSLARLSPEASRLRTELTPATVSHDAQPSSPEARRAAPLSLYPASTRRDLALLVMALAMFVAGSLVFASPRGGVTLCVTLAVAGGVLAFFEIAQQLTGSVAWRLGWSDASRNFGPFICRNNAAGYLNLCLGGSLGMVVWALGRTETGLPREWPSGSFWRRAVVAPLARLDATLIVSLSLAACSAAGVLCTLSRGGALALSAAAVVTLVAGAAARFSAARIFALATVVAAGVGLVGWVGLTGSLQARFAMLLDRAALAQTRLPHWRDGLCAAGDFWPVGSGLGTYRFVYPLYQRRNDVCQYLHAENQYLETLVESGVPGLAAMLAMILVLGAAAWRLLRYSGLPAGMALGVAGMFAVVSQSLHGLVDFGMWIPANLLTLALLGGAVAGAAAALGRRMRQAKATAAWIRYGSWAFTLLVLASTAWGVAETRAAAAVDEAVRTARLLQLAPAPPASMVRGEIETLTRALAGRPDDAESRQHLAELWLALYRTAATEQLRREQPGLSPVRLAELSSSLALHERAHQFRRGGDPEKLESLRGQPVVQQSLPEATACARAAARCCPLLLDPHMTLARLAFLAGDPGQDELHLARARRIQPADPEVLFRCGLLELQAGRFEQACCDWRQSLQLSQKRLQEVLHRAETQMSFPYIVEKLLPDSPAMLLGLARTRYAGEHHANTRRLIAGRADRLLDRAPMGDDERHYLRAAARLLEGRRAEAAAEYELAVAIRPRDVEWRYELAVLLKAEGKLAQAHEHACLCAATQPRNAHYRALLESINHDRLTGKKELR